MNNLLEVKNDILKPLAENELKEKLTKKVVLKYVSQMRIFPIQEDPLTTLKVYSLPKFYLDKYRMILR